MTTWMLILLVAVDAGFGTPSIAVVPEFVDRDACYRTGTAFKEAAKKKYEVQFYCVAAEGRGE